MEASDKEMTNSQNAKRTGSEYERYSPDYFPGTVKPSASIEGHLFFCALACVQESLQMIPKAKPLFNNIIEQLESPGCRKISEINNSDIMSSTRIFGKMTTSYLYKERYKLSLAWLFLLLKILRLLPFLLSKDSLHLVKLVRQYIIGAFNRDPENPKITISANNVVLMLTVIIAARFSEKNIDPYEYDRKHNPLKAEMARSRPKTREGREFKTRYNKALRDLGFQKSYDKHYKNGARKWLMARVICYTVTEAAKQMNISWEQLYKDLKEFDIAMGYPRN